MWRGSKRSDEKRRTYLWLRRDGAETPVGVSHPLLQPTHFSNYRTRDAVSSDVPHRPRSDRRRGSTHDLTPHGTRYFTHTVRKLEDGSELLSRRKMTRHDGSVVPSCLSSRTFARDISFEERGDRERYGWRGSEDMKAFDRGVSETRTISVASSMAVQA